MIEASCNVRWKEDNDTVEWVGWFFPANPY